MKEEYYEIILMSNYGTNEKASKTKLDNWWRDDNPKESRDFSQPLTT